MRVKEYDVVASGGAASANETIQTGEVYGIYVSLGSGVTAADVEVANQGRDILNKAGIAANTYYPVRENAVASGGAAITNSFVPCVVNGTVTITLANVTGNTAGTVTVLVFYK